LERLQRLHVAMDVAKAVMRTVPIDLVRPGTSLRRQFPENEIDELAASIREKGVLQPVLVRPRGEVFELIAGKRGRWRHSGSPCAAGFVRYSPDSRRFRGQDRASDRLGQRQIATPSATGDRSSRLTAR